MSDGAIALTSKVVDGSVWKTSQWHSVPVMGSAFLVLGAVVLVANASFLMNAAMAVGFGGLHLGFGWYIARKHGG